MHHEQHTGCVAEAGEGEDEDAQHKGAHEHVAPTKIVETQHTNSRSGEGGSSDKFKSMTEIYAASR